MKRHTVLVVLLGMLFSTSGQTQSEIYLNISIGVENTVWYQKRVIGYYNLIESNETWKSDVLTTSPVRLSIGPRIVKDTWIQEIDVFTDFMTEVFWDPYLFLGIGIEYSSMVALDNRLRSFGVNAAGSYQVNLDNRASGGLIYQLGPVIGGSFRFCPYFAAGNFYNPPYASEGSKYRIGWGFRFTYTFDNYKGKFYSDRYN